jgi:hypothetical protein
MEEVLPAVRTVIVEPGTAVMPYLPLDEHTRPARRARDDSAQVAPAAPKRDAAPSAPRAAAEEAAPVAPSPAPEETR